jgi:hypothetical protein
VLSSCQSSPVKRQQLDYFYGLVVADVVEEDSTVDLATLDVEDGPLKVVDVVPAVDADLSFTPEIPIPASS